MHPNLLYQLAAARNDELRQRAARVSAARPARSAIGRWSRWLRRAATAPAGGPLKRDRGATRLPTPLKPITAPRPEASAPHRVGAGNTERNSR